MKETDMNKEILDAAKDVATSVLAQHQDITLVYPIPVGDSRLCMSADGDKIVGPDVIVVGTTTFHLGFCRHEVT